jgi:hypothetical protein
MIAQPIGRPHSGGRRAFLVNSLVALLLLTAGCDSASVKEIWEALKHGSEWRQQLDELKDRVTQLETEKSSLADDLSELQGKVSYLETVDSMRGTATFDPAGSGFQRVDTSVASFAVSIEDVRPYADGVRVKLNVGNLTSASVNGATFKVKWGARMPDTTGAEWAKRYVAWNRSLQEQTINVTNELKPATWNAVRLTLPKTKPTDFGYLELSMDASSISLLKPR